ncbi:MAG: hypothetical protein ACM3ND_04390 [Acidobacteriota bacterium]
MLLRKNLDNRLLLIAGITFIALRSVLQTMIKRAGHSSDVTDFALGLLFGVGIGTLILFVWRLQRDERGKSNGARQN